MNFFKTFLITALTLLLCSTTNAQVNNDEENLSLNSGTKDNQFEFVFRKSGNFKGTKGQKYAAVKQAWLL
jgi:hypothetical protein